MNFTSGARHTQPASADLRNHRVLELFRRTTAHIRLDGRNHPGTLRGRRAAQHRADRTEPAPAKAGVKDNQPTLNQTIAEISATTEALGIKRSHDIGRGRDERLTVTVFDPADKLADNDRQSHVAAIVRCRARSTPATARPDCYAIPPRPPSTSPKSQ